MRRLTSLGLAITAALALAWLARTPEPDELVVVGPEWGSYYEREWDEIARRLAE